MKRLILILIISLVLSQTNYETQKEEVNSGIKYENVILGCRPSKRCIDERCKIPCGRYPPTRPRRCGPGEVYNNGKCERKKPYRCLGIGCTRQGPKPPIRCGPGEIRIRGRCQKKPDDVPKEE